MPPWRAANLWTKSYTTGTGRRQFALRRSFTTTQRRLEVRDLAQLPPRVPSRVSSINPADLLVLAWPSPPRNILLVRKDDDTVARDSLLEFARHVHSTYPQISVALEPDVANELHELLPFPVYTASTSGSALYADKIDLTSTFGGDGTILHAASLFATASSVPPILSFSMGRLGFLGEWKFKEYKRAFREVYVSGAPPPLPSALAPGTRVDATAAQDWSATKGKHMGCSRNSRVLLRSRLRIGLFDPDGQQLPHESPIAHGTNRPQDVFALNEVALHRGALPHLAYITILIGSPPHQRTLTTAIADGFLVSTPTGSTAYSLSSGGSIVHPLVPSLLLTPIAARSLSFRPLVLPANTPITLRIDAENRGKEIELSVDGVRRQQRLCAGMEVRVVGEKLRSPGTREWVGGVPSVVRSSGAADAGGDHWVGGLNSLLKFNYPFGEDEH